MSNQFSLNIKTPCIENFKDFAPTSNGGFCNSCEKEVIDFTKMSSQEIVTYFQTKKSADTCGLFKSSQLHRYNKSIPKRSSVNFLNGFALVLLSLFYFNEMTAQEVKNKIINGENPPSKFQSILHKKNIAVKGTVVENMIPLPGVNIMLEGTTMGTSTDFDGNFEFPVKLKKGDVLVFSYVGMNSKKVVITNDNSGLNVTLKVNLKMDSCILMGKVAVKKIYKSK